MITKDTSLYSELFEKANNLLGYTENNELYIKDIDMYFRNLGYIAGRANGDISYFMLPIEEPLFEINANTRNIAIPDEFKNGISVQGDEIAETIFFSIDRYFDTTDFYSDYIVPVIQWKYADEKDYHLSATTGKVVIEDKNSKTGGTIKVVFGWPISSEVTERATNIQFGVRFYTIVNEAGELITNPADYADGTLEYSFSTLNALTRINPSLEIKLDSGDFDYVNKTDLIWKRMRNSSPADLNLQAIMPILEYYEPGEGAIVDLDGENYILKVKATYPSGTVNSRLGKQIYQIIRGENELVAEGEVVSVYDNSINEPFGIDYLLSEDKTRNSTDIYYTLETADGDLIYKVYDEPNLQGELYERVFTCPINKAGKYSVQIINRLSGNNEASIKTGIFEIAMPEQPIFSSDENAYRAILRGEPVVLKLIVSNEENTTYQWYKDNLPIEGATTNEYNVNDIGNYSLEATNFRNNEIAKIMSNIIRVTEPASAPVSFEYKLGKNFTVEVEGDIVEIERSNLKLTVIPQAERADSFNYIWYNGNDGVIGEGESISVDREAGTIIYCKVESVYNGDISEQVETVKFKIV